MAGNPNSVKSTLINGIAGTRLHVGNWPGVTAVQLMELGIPIIVALNIYDEAGKERLHDNNR